MYAVIDIGSNTVRMCVYGSDKGRLFPMMNDRAPCGLAAYVEDQCLNEEGIAALTETIEEFKMVIANIGIQTVYPFATAALRLLGNKETIVERVYNETGLKIDVISGKEEARYDYYGIIHEMRSEKGIMTDVGGGSTEIASFTKKGPVSAVTMPVGSLGLYRDCVHDIVPTETEMNAIADITSGHLDSINLPDTEGVKEFFAVGGSVRATCKVANKLFGRPLEANKLSAGDYEKLFEIYREDHMKLCRAVLKTRPDRIHTVIPGMCIQQAILKRLGCDEMTVSASGVRDGYLMAKTGMLIRK